MTKVQFSRMRLRFTGVIALGIWAVLLWKHFHGGVPTHHLLRRADLPGLSCWWDALILPSLTWMLLARIHPRLVMKEEEGSANQKLSHDALLGFCAAILVGVLLSVLFTFGQETTLSYLMDALLIAALWLPIYRAECVLGFVLGMTFTFGSVLPLLFGSIVAGVSAVLYRFVRPVIVRIGLWIYGV